MLGPSSRYLCAIALLVVVGITACGAQGTPAQQAASLVTKGLEAQLAGDLSTAQNDYQQAIQLDNSNKYAHYDLGTIYDKQGNHAQAIQEYHTTLGLDPNFVDALFNLAVDTAASDPQSAENLYRKVLALQPTWASAWLNLGFVLMTEGRDGEARAAWARATTLDPSLASHIPSSTPSPSASSSPSPTH
jgi:tetratricopeptide (TPR) repeat protein